MAAIRDRSGHPDSSARYVWRLSVSLSLPLAATRADAHPFPNSVISLGVEEHLISLDIGIPAPELMHVLTGDAHADASTFLASRPQDLRAYLAAHIALQTETGVGPSCYGAVDVA